MRALLGRSVSVQTQLPALHPQSKLKTLRCGGEICIVVDFWDLVSAPALMEVSIACSGLKFTDHSRRAPPAAAAALQRGNLNACFKVITDTESLSLLQPEIKTMESCGMLVQILEEIGMSGNRKAVISELERSAPIMIEEMRDVRRSNDLPLSPAQLSNHAQRLTDDSCLEHALQQQAWHAEFVYHKICGFGYLKGPNLLSVL